MCSQTPKSSALTSSIFPTVSLATTKVVMPTGFDEQTLGLLGSKFSKRSRASAGFTGDANENDGNLTAPIQQFKVIQRKRMV